MQVHFEGVNVWRLAHERYRGVIMQLLYVRDAILEKECCNDRIKTCQWRSRSFEGDDSVVFHESGVNDLRSRRKEMIQSVAV